MSQNTACIVPHWGLRQLYQSGLSSTGIYLLLIVAGAAVFGLVQALFPEVSEGSAIYGVWPEEGGGFYIFSVMLGGGGGFFLATIIAVSRVVEYKMHPGFVRMDTGVDGLLAKAALGATSGLGGIAITLLIAVMMMNYVLRADAGLSLFEPAGILAAGLGVFVQAYVLSMVYALIAGLALGGYFQGLYYLLCMAREISIDILNAEAYSGVTMSPAVLFVVSSVLFTVLGLVWLVSDPFRDASFIQAWTMLLLAGFFLILLVSMYPMLVLRNRIAEEVSRERDLLVTAIRGQVDALGASRLAEPGMTRAELMMCLSLVNTVSEWPVSAQVKKILLFGVIPPVAWSLAAIVENTIY